jgi:mutator protein MutT
MKLEEYKKQHNVPAKQATLCFLLREDQILLAMKKRGVGAGRYNGTGGKLNPGESLEQALKRETQEEIAVAIEDPEKVAVLDFYFRDKPGWNQQVHAYFCKSWQGEPTESEEMKPQWFSKDSLPYEDMWPDDIYWIPEVLSGKKIHAEFLFGEGDQVLDYKIKNKLYG